MLRVIRPAKEINPVLAAASWISAVVEVAEEESCKLDALARINKTVGVMGHDAAKLDEIEWIIEWNLELRT